MASWGNGGAENSVTYSDDIQNKSRAGWSLPPSWNCSYTHVWLVHDIHISNLARAKDHDGGSQLGSAPRHFYPEVKPQFPYPSSERR